MISLTDPLLYLHTMVALTILLLPGIALYFLVFRLTRRAAQAQLSTAFLSGFGLSVALWPILLLSSTLATAPFFPFVPWTVLGVSILYLLFEAWRRIDTAYAPRAQSSLFGTHAVLAALTLTSLAFRLLDAQGLAVPLFGDSLHHTMITSLIVERGAVPNDYLPFVPVETFTYHFGFHSIAATFAYLTGTSAPYAVLLLGQVMITLAVPLAYFLNLTLFRSRLTGLFAAALTGFVSLMPAFYVNWGRYTQLAGQLLLIVALVLLVRIARERAGAADAILLSVCVGGLVLVHYRILLFFGLFAIPLVVWLFLYHGGEWKESLRRLGVLTASILAGLLLALPWILNLVSNYLEGLTRRLSTVNSEYLQLYNDLNTLATFVGRTLPTIALFGTIVALTMLIRYRIIAPHVTTISAERMALISGEGLNNQREKSGAVTREQALNKRWSAALALTIAVWVGLLIASLYAVPGAIGTTAVAIMLFIPLSALGGYGLGVLGDLAASRRPIVRGVLMVSLLAAAPLASAAVGTVQVADTGRYNYVQHADLEAFDWIKDNIPSNARFLISSEFSYTGRAVTASDAGMWLPLLTGRNVSVPALNSWMERPSSSDFFTQTRHLAAYTQPFTMTADLPDPGSTQYALVERGYITEPQELGDPETISLMKELGITHVYVGSPEGWSAPRLDVEAMKRDALYFKQVYSKDGVYIFQVADER